MGRKIPAKKHRGVKDPLVQQARRLQSLKSKINAPPKDPDEQPVPRSLTRLFEFQNKHKDSKTFKKKKVLKRLEHGHNNDSNRGSDNPVSQLHKLPGETGRDFTLRINSAMKALHSPVEQLHYPQDLMEEEDEKGARMAAQRERRARKRTRAQKLAGEHQDEQPTRAQRRTAKKLHNKQKALEAAQEKREVVYERVPFGDVCHAPPTLRPHGRPRDSGAGPPAPAGRPARRGLLLAAMLPGGGGGGGGGGGAPPGPAPRAAAVAAYRALRANKQKPTGNT